MVYGVLILYVVLYINELHVFVCWVYSYKYLVSSIINVVYAVCESA